MGFPALLSLFPLVAMLVVAAAIDVRSRRIPNWLTLAMIAGGLAQSLLPGSVIGAGQSTMGIGAGFALTFILFAIGAMGGGDVKMFAGIGAWIGPGPVFQVFAVSAVVGMAIALAQAMRQRRMAALLRNSAVIVLNAASSGELGCPKDMEEQHSAIRNRLPYAAPTLVAVILVLLFQTRSIL